MVIKIRSRLAKTVPNALNILQACIHKSVNTGLFLKITYSPKYCQIKSGNDPHLNIFVLKSENKHEHIEMLLHVI